MAQDNEADLGEIRKQFTYFDRDRNGLLNFHEFHELLRVISPASTTDQAAEGFSMIDVNCDGYVDFQEFAEWWKKGWYEY